MCLNRNLKHKLFNTLRSKEGLIMKLGQFDTENMLKICTRKQSQKQPSRGVPRKRCSENMQQIYRRTPIAKCDFNKVAIEITLQHGCSPVNLLHIFEKSFPKNTSGRLLLGPHIWNLLPEYIKAETNFINQWSAPICKCNLCVYVNKQVRDINFSLLFNLF